ncbi:MAG: hypothetical protein P1U40_03610 [Coxiellaceae bacterium]|nr:hypothetical protein [Coxiellaceae bacterium]
MGRTTRPTSPTPEVTPKSKPTPAPTPKPQFKQGLNKELDKLQQQVEQLAQDQKKQQKKTPKPSPDPMGSLLKLIAVMRKCLNGRGNNPLMQQKLGQMQQLMPQMPKQLAPQMQQVMDTANTQNASLAPRPTPGSKIKNEQDPSTSIEQRDEKQAQHHAGKSATGKGISAAASAAAITPLATDLAVK